MDVAIGLLMTVGGGLAAFALFVLAVPLLHEAAHAIVGVLVGFHVVAIEIGAGPRVPVRWLAGCASRAVDGEGHSAPGRR